MSTLHAPAPVVNPTDSDHTADEPTLEDAPAPYTAEDLEWAAVELNEDADDYAVEPERDWDEMAHESAALDCLARGLIPPDVAGYISRTSLVGHPA